MDKISPGQPGYTDQFTSRLNKRLNGDTMKNKAKTMLEGLNQYVNSDRVYKPVTDTKKILEPGVYEVKQSMEGIFFEKVTVNTDALIKINTSKYNYLMEEIRNFWDSADEFKEMEMMNKRAFMLHSIPGTGKSCILKQVMVEMTENKNITFIGRDAYTLVAGLKLFREVEESRKALVILEEVDEMVDRGGSKALADLLDGPDSINDIFYLGTTNYIERIPERLLRPSRFDRLVEILSPSNEDRYEYFKAKLAKKNVTDELIKEYVAATDKFTFADMKEFLVSVVCLKNDIKETVNRLRKVKSGDKNAYRGYDDTSSATVAMQFQEALAFEDISRLAIDEALKISETSEMKITLSRGAADLLGLTPQATKDWLEKISGSADVKANPALDVFHVTGSESEKFKSDLIDKLKTVKDAKVWVDDKLVLDGNQQMDMDPLGVASEPKDKSVVLDMDTPDIDTTKQPELKMEPGKVGEEESITTTELKWKPGKFAMVVQHKGTNFYKKESKRDSNGNVEYVMYLAKNGNKLKVVNSDSEGLLDVSNSAKTDEYEVWAETNGDQQPDGKWSDKWQKVLRKLSKADADKESKVLAAKLKAKTVVVKYGENPNYKDNYKKPNEGAKPKGTYGDEKVELGSVDILKEKDNTYSVYQNTKKLKGGFINHANAGLWAAKHFDVDADMFRESKEFGVNSFQTFHQYKVAKEKGKVKYPVYVDGFTYDSEKDLEDNWDKDHEDMDPSGGYGPHSHEGAMKQHVLDNQDFTDIEAWKKAVKKHHPSAKITKDDGKGNTYGGEGTFTAHIGPDMQADVIGTFDSNDDYGWISPSKSNEGSMKEYCMEFMDVIESEGGEITMEQAMEACAEYMSNGYSPKGAAADYLKTNKSESNKIITVDCTAEIDNHIGPCKAEVIVHDKDDMEVISVYNKYGALSGDEISNKLHKEIIDAAQDHINSQEESVKYRVGTVKKRKNGRFLKKTTGWVKIGDDMNKNESKLDTLLRLTNEMARHDYTGVKDAAGDKPDNKDIMRLEDIKDKAGGDEAKVLSLASTMAKLIKDPDKAMRRAKAAKLVFAGDLGKKVYDIFTKIAASATGN